MSTPHTTFSNRSLVAALNRCIEACADGAKGYAIAERQARDFELKLACRRHSDERALFVRQLRQLVLDLGAEAAELGSTTATLHRGWLGARLALEGHSDAVVLEECERGERSALRAYERASELVPPHLGEARRLLHGQAATILSSLDEIEWRLRRMQ